MPRKARIDAPGALHHVIVRGLNRQTIFADPSDHRFFLERLAQLLEESGTRCFAWALLPNHFHLLLQTGHHPLTFLMQKLLTAHAVRFNRRHDRVGHLFQNRYRSILCQEEPYLLELVRYIHLNPLRAGLVADLRALRTYAYCGHGVLLGRLQHPWQDRHTILARFGVTENAARRRYDQFVAKGVDMGRRSDLAGGGLLRSQGGWAAIKANRRVGDYQKGDERILGDGRFVDRALKRAEERLQRRYRLQQAGYDLDKLIALVADCLQITTAMVLDRQRDRRRTTARDLLCFLATDRLGITQATLAQRLHRTQSAISHAAARGRALMAKDAYPVLNRLF